MGTYVAPTPTIRTSRVLVGVIVVAFVCALALGVALATRAISFGPATTSQDALVRVQPGLSADYPPHYGLAGPSGVLREAYTTGGAPVHGGLAGPSRVVREAYTTGGAPVHGGLAGPSTVGSSH